jgi:membrane fusion protein (multidrug efflux system)
VNIKTDSGRPWLVVLAMSAGLAAACEKKAPPAPPPPPEVFVADVVQKDVPVYLELVGQTKGFQDVDIRARIEGFLESVNFREGSLVRKGELLYTIDRKPLEATLAGARADQATAQARLEKATNDVKRYTPLAAKQAVSQQELDNAKAAEDAARSQVEASKAAVDKAALDLGYTTVRAPIDGLVGVTQVKPGNLVGRSESTLLTTISQINPIIFRVAATEADYLRYSKRQTAKTGAAPIASDIQLTLADNSVYPQTGRVSLVDRAVDPTTGTLGMEITFANPDLLLRPGQYGRARLLLDTVSGALLVPQRAVQELQNLTSVAVVDSNSKVTFRTVKTGLRVGSLWVIDDGLKPGEKVVTEGLQRIQDGMTVSAKPAPPEATAPQTAALDGGAAQAASGAGAAQAASGAGAAQAASGAGAAQAASGAGAAQAASGVK